jgi:hypothetical protein
VKKEPTTLPMVLLALLLVLLVAMWVYSLTT